MKRHKAKSKKGQNILRHNGRQVLNKNTSSQILHNVPWFLFLRNGI